MAKFNYAVCYFGGRHPSDAPRTGGTEKSMLCGADGLPMIQGGSLAVLRSYLALEQGEEAAKHLFGSSEGLGVDSMLTVSDGRFQTKRTPRAGPVCALTARPVPGRTESSSIPMACLRHHIFLPAAAETAPPGRHADTGRHAGGRDGGNPPPSHARRGDHHRRPALQRLWRSGFGGAPSAV